MRVKVGSSIRCIVQHHLMKSADKRDGCDSPMSLCVHHVEPESMPGNQGSRFSDLLEGRTINASAQHRSTCDGMNVTRNKRHHRQYARGTVRFSCCSDNVLQVTIARACGWRPPTSPLKRIRVSRLVGRAVRAKAHTE